MDAKYLLIVKVSRGLKIMDSPRPESQGGVSRRVVPVGTPLDAYSIHNVGGVDYARLIPQNPLKREWVRVAEADHSIEYVDVIPLDTEGSDIASALREIADAIRSKGL